MQLDGYDLNLILKNGLTITDKNGGPSIGRQLVGALFDAALKGLKNGDLAAFSMIREMLKEGSLAAVGAQEEAENEDMPTGEEGKSGPKHLCSVQGGCVSAS